MYCTAACPFCQSAEQLLVRKGAKIDKIRVDLQPELRAEMTRKAGGRRTVPQIWIGSRHVGVCLDTGNNIALLEDPDVTVETLAPLAVSVHLKDMAVAEYADGWIPIGGAGIRSARHRHDYADVAAFE